MVIFIGAMEKKLLVSYYIKCTTKGLDINPDCAHLYLFSHFTYNRF